MDYGRLMAATAQRAYNPTHARMGECVGKYAAQFRLLDNGCKRLVTLIAETCHETARYTRWEEGLNYTPQRLVEVWPGRYSTTGKDTGKPNARARSVAGNPQALANDTYGGRMGNVAANDGWTYRGRGPTMLTGKAAYAAMAGVTGLDLIGHPELAADPYAGMLIAMWFYQQRGVFAALTDEDERRAVQGGLLGLREVQGYKRRAVVALSHP